MPIIGITGWILLLRCKRFWRNLDRAMNFILANTIQHKDADGRISRDNKAWAKTIPMPEDKESFRRNAYLVVDQVNPGLVDLFARQARRAVQEKAKSSVLQKLKQELPAHKPAAPKKQGPER